VGSTTEERAGAGVALPDRAGCGRGGDEPRGSFPTDDALIKLLYLGCKDLGRTRRTRKNQGRSGYIWKTALNQLEIMYPDRLQLT
jgi:hypothetical protein